MPKTDLEALKKKLGKPGAYRNGVLVLDLTPAESRVVLAAAENAERVERLVKIINDSPIISKYHGNRGFEDDRFIDDYNRWCASTSALLREHESEVG